MEEMEMKTAYMPVKDLTKRYLDQKKYLEYCRKCPKYNSLWSCPPFDTPAEEYLKDYKGIYLIGTRLPISQETRDEIFLPESQQEFAEELLVSAREKLERWLLRLEQQTAGTRAMSAGSCKICSKCEKLVGMPCRQPGKMRYSLEALGFNVTGISEEVLNMPIKWIDKQLPEYLMLVHGLLVKEEEPLGQLELDEDQEGFCFRK